MIFMLFEADTEALTVLGINGILSRNDSCGDTKTPRFLGVENCLVNKYGNTLNNDPIRKSNEITSTKSKIMNKIALP